LEAVNDELQQEIIERKSVEEELIIHRDYLEGMITEGTRELEIKNQEIEASEKKFRTITSSIADAIIMIDSDGRVSFWNEAAREIFGYRADEIQGEKLCEYIVPGYPQKENTAGFEICKKVDKEKSGEESIETEARRKNGAVFPIEVRLSAVNIQDGLHTIAVMRDITRKKAEERDLRILSSAVEQSSVVILITDTTGVIQYVNPKFTEITGYDREEVPGKTPNILNSREHSPEFFKDLWLTVSSGREWCGELHNRKKNGEFYWDSTLISPIKDQDGTITHFVAIKEDITLRKQMELELVEARKSAEAASRSKSEFLANVSHEIRTPMNAIIGMTELTLDTRLNKEQREYLNIVQHSSTALLGLLNDILDLSKIEAGKLVLEPIVFNLHENLKETAKTLAVQAYQKELELVYYIDPEVPEQLIGDVGRLRQIIINLIGNSIKFTEDGEIVLKVEVLERFPADNEVLLHFMVSDTGIGIPKNKLTSIFEKFSQADASTTRKYGGSGLGLGISSRLVTLMDGIIWADSPSTFPHFCDSGVGSTFHFTTLFEMKHTATPVARGIDLSKLNGLPVLIVDDNETNRRFLDEVLGKYGMSPEIAGGGSEALALLEKKQYRLLILDFQMPEMDGGTLLVKIRDELQLQVPVILLSSGIKTEDIARLKELGFSAHFLKPVDSRELLGTIADILGYRIAGEPDEEQPKPVTLPKVGSGAATGTDTAGKPVAKTGTHILVAEDNPINQQLIRRFLEKRGHRVHIAENGSEAVDMFRMNLREMQNKRYRMIFMDIQMPVMDGVKATARIRRYDETIPIIALTAHAMKGDRAKFLEAGMNDYISKPIKKSLLFGLLDKYIIARDREGKNEKKQN
ncbi:MAG: response regulator, partial [bacterium]|nr:response regulator [bacterium]